MASRVASELAKKGLIDQWDGYCEAKQTFLESLNNYAKYCEDMSPKMKMTDYLRKLVGKSPNEAKEREWKNDVGLTDQDCVSSRSSRASSRSSGISLTPAKRKQVADQLAMSVNDSHPYYGEMQQAETKEGGFSANDMKKSFGEVMGKLNELSGSFQSLNRRVENLEDI